MTLVDVGALTFFDLHLVLWVRLTVWKILLDYAKYGSYWVPDLEAFTTFVYLSNVMLSTEVELFVEAVAHYSTQSYMHDV